MENIVEIRNLVRKFGDFAAVDNISLSVRPGEIFAFLGPNGAGKTTTIKMLTTLLKPTSGTINLNGFDVLGDPQNARRSFGIVFQDQSLDDELTSKENMEIHCVLYKVPKGEREKKTEELLKMVELWDRRDETIKKFSGGMKRRLEIARGLLHNPKVLFLDEPTLGLDPQTRNHIWDYIAKLVLQGVTVFFTTHYMEEAERYATRIAIIDRGKIAISGTPSEIKERSGKQTLEEAFIALTGREMRDDEANADDRMRMMGRVWKR